jgi:hypothetical protein
MGEMGIRLLGKWIGRLMEKLIEGINNGRDVN